MNQCFLIGNLTKDVELRTTQNGVANCAFTLAVNRRFKNAQGETETDFFNIVAWRQLAELCAKYLSKGRKCAVTGSIQNRSYQAQDGSKRYVTEIIAENVEFLSSQQGEEAPAKKEKTNNGFTEVNDDELPF